jgi:hypothetical protein
MVMYSCATSRGDDAHKHLMLCFPLDRGLLGPQVFLGIGKGIEHKRSRLPLEAGLQRLQIAGNGFRDSFSRDGISHGCALPQRPQAR